MTLQRKFILFAAIRMNNVAIVDSILFSSSESRHLRADGTDFHLLLKAIEYNRKDIVELLLERGCRPNLPSYDGSTPLHLVAAKRNWQSLLRQLLARGAKVNQRNRYNDTALHVAFDASADEMVARTLLRAHLKRSTSNETNDAGLSYLHIACATADVESVRILVEVGGADVNAQVKHDAKSPYAGSTPLHMAVEFCKYNIIEYLLVQGAHVYSVDRNNSTPIHLALELGETEVIQLLFDYADAWLNCINSYGLTHFMAACACPEPEIAQHFLANKFNGNRFFNANEVVDGGEDESTIFTLKGFTPLHFAAIFGRFDTTKLLLDDGARCCAVTHAGITPEQFALKKGYQDVASLIKARCRGYDWLLDC